MEIPLASEVNLFLHLVKASACVKGTLNKFIQSIWFSVFFYLLSIDIETI